MIRATLTKAQAETLISLGMQAKINNQANKVEIAELEIIYTNFSEDGDLLSIELLIATDEDLGLDLD